MKRKFTYLLMLLFCLCTTAWADNFVPQDGVNYIIQCKGDSKKLIYNTECVKSETDNTVIMSSWANYDNRSWFKVKAAEGYNGYFYIESANTTGAYMYAINTNNADSNVGIKSFTTPDETCLWSITTQGDGFNIIPKNGSCSLNNRGSYNGNQHVGMWNENSEPNDIWYFMIESTINYTYNVPGHSEFTKTISKTQLHKQGTSINLNPDELGYVSELGGIVYNKENTVNGENVTVNTYAPFMFKYANKYDATTAHWYAIDMHNNQNSYLWKSNNTAVELPVTAMQAPSRLTDEYMWTFVGNLTDGFKVYNKATGKAIVLTEKTSGNNTYKEAELAEEGQLFKVSASTGKNKLNNGFGFCLYQGTNTYLNHQDNIKTWNKADEGSTMHVFEPVTWPVNYAKNITSTTIVEGAIGLSSAYTEDNINKLTTAVNNVNTSATEDNVKALETLNATFANTNDGATVEADKYYRLRNVHLHSTKQNAYPTYNGSQFTKGNNAKNLETILKFTAAADGKFYIQVNGQYLSKVSDNNPVTTVTDVANAGTYTVEHSGQNFTFTETSNAAVSNSSLHMNAGNMIFYTKNAGASVWNVFPATEAELPLTTVGSEALATAYLPFPVSQVSGAKAYIGAISDNNTYLNLTEAANGFAAEDGVVLVGTEGSQAATVTIGGNAQKVEGNALSGTLSAITLADNTRANYLVFGVNENKAGFYVPSSSVASIPANKAFISATNLHGVQALALNFGTVTGINAATVNGVNANAPLYDLSGRRVLRAVKGGLYIQNGRKVLK